MTVNEKICNNWRMDIKKRCKSESKYVIYMIIHDRQEMTYFCLDCLISRLAKSPIFREGFRACMTLEEFTKKEVEVLEK